MSQYSRPLAVFVGAPVTLVGPPVAGFAGALWAGAFWATTRMDSASIVMARMRVFIVPLSCSCHVLTQVLFKPAQSHQFQSGHLSEAGLLRRWSAPAAP